MTVSAIFPVRARTSPAPLTPACAVAVALVMVGVWALWAAHFNTAQFGDSVEQFNWAQSLEWGYQKHPPLPSWVLGAMVKCFGTSIHWAYFLGALFLAGTAGFTWSIGRQLAGDRVAAAAVLLWGLNLSFSQRVQLYNHNTLLVFCVAATVWCAMRATAQREAVWWFVTGIAAAAALLSKYQAAVPLAGLLLTLGLTGQLRRPDQWRGVVIAIGVMLALFAPHAVWVTQHDFSTLRYASDAVEVATFGQRIGFLASFAANQLRMASPALVAIAGCVAWARLKPQGPIGEAAAASRSNARPDLGVWMFGLIGAT